MGASKKVGLKQILSAAQNMPFFLRLAFIFPNMTSIFINNANQRPGIRIDERVYKRFISFRSRKQMQMEY